MEGGKQTLFGDHTGLQQLKFTEVYDLNAANAFLYSSPIRLRNEDCIKECFKGMIKVAKPRKAGRLPAQEQEKLEQLKEKQGFCAKSLKRVRKIYVLGKQA